MTQVEVKIRLPVPIPPSLLGDVLAKLHYVHESVSQVFLSDDLGQTVRLRLKPGVMASPDLLSERVIQAVSRMCSGSATPLSRVHVDRLNRPVPFSEDPLPLLKSADELWEENRGSYVLGSLLSRLVDFFDWQVLDMAKRFGARPYQFPSMLNVTILEKVRYLRSFPHALSLIYHLREDLDLIDRFAKETKCTDSRLEVNPEHVTGAENVLSPSVCFHFYGILQNRNLADGPRVATALGRCFRYEAGNLRGLERLWEFTMREIIFVGSKDFVLESRARCLEETVRLFDGLDLAYSIENATDPFFISDFAAQAAFQSAFDLKQEVRLKLPFCGRTIAGGSINYHIDFFSRALNITEAKGNFAHTACIGLGFERCAYALLAQYGLEPAKWPKPVRSWMEEHPQ